MNVSTPAALKVDRCQCENPGWKLRLQLRRPHSWAVARLASPLYIGILRTTFNERSERSGHVTAVRGHLTDIAKHLPTAENAGVFRDLDDV